MKNFVKNLAEKLKSWAMWLALAALAAYIVRLFGGIDISGSLDGLLDVLLPVLVGLGIVNNPNSRDSI